MPNSFGNLQAEDAVLGDMADDAIAAEIIRCDEFLADIENEQFVKHQVHRRYGGRTKTLIARKSALRFEQDYRVRVSRVPMRQVGYFQALVEVNAILGDAASAATSEQLDLLTDIIKSVGNLNDKAKG